MTFTFSFFKGTTKGGGLQTQQTIITKTHNEEREDKRGEGSKKRGAGL